MILSINSIPLEQPIIIYGYGHAGSMLLKLLKLYRPEQKIRYIVDDNLNSNIDNIPVIKGKELVDIYEDGDLVLISILIHEKIEEELKKHSNIKYSLVRLNYFHDDKEFEFFKELSISSKEYIPQVYSLENYDKSKEFEKVLSLFDRIEDKVLYSTIIKGWHEKSDLIKDYFVNEFPSIGRHYFEYMDFSSMNTILEGGVADGTNTIEFLSSLSSKSKIYGFDPLFDNYTHTKNKKYLLNCDNFEIVTKGLWHKDDSLDIDISGLLPLARVSQKGESNFDKSKTISVTSVDNFVKEENIEKVDFIKLDIEGAELNCLQGAVNTLKKDRPQLSISIYHKYEDLYEIPLFLDEVLDNYTYRLGHYHYELGETVLYAFPNEI